MSNQNYLRELEKNIASFAKVGESTRRQVSAFGSIGRQISGHISSINRANFSIKLPDIYSSLLVIDTTNLLKAIETSLDIIKVVKPISTWNDIYTERVSVMTKGMAILSRRITADFVAINVASLNITTSGIFNKLIRLVEFNKDAVEAYNAAGWPIAPSMPLELRDHVVSLHKQNKTRYISRAIMGYFQP